MYFGSSNGYSGISVGWLFWMGIGLSLVGASTVAYWILSFLFHHVRWIG
jgi:hypothetical protein